MRVDIYAYSFPIPHILFIWFLCAVIRRLIFKPGEEFVRYVDPYPVADEHESDGDAFWHGLVSFRLLFEELDSFFS